MRSGHLSRGLRRTLGLGFLSAAMTVGPWGPASAVDKDLDLDGSCGVDSFASLDVVSTSPVKIRNKITNKALGKAFTFNWPSAGPGGFASSVAAGTATGVGTIWEWQTTSTVYSLTGSTCANDICFNDKSTGAASGPFSVPGRSLSPSGVSLSSASLTSSLLTFFSPPVELVHLSGSVQQLVSGQFLYKTRVENLTAAAITFDLLHPPLPCAACIQGQTVPPGAVFETCQTDPHPSMDEVNQLFLCGSAIPDGPAGTRCTNAEPASQWVAVIPVPDPTKPVGSVFLTPYDAQLTDSNSDGTVDALSVSLLNAGPVTLTSVSAILTSPPVDLTDDGINNPIPVNITQDTSPYPDVKGTVPSGPADCANPIIAPVSPSPNTVPFKVTFPANHPPDVGRPFNLNVSGQIGLGGPPFQMDVPLTIGYGGPSGSCSASAPATYSSTDVPKTISPGISTVISEVTVSGAGPYLADLGLATFIAHTASGLLEFTLTSPAGTVVTVSSLNGGSFDNVFNGTVWDERADPGNQAPFPGNTFPASHLVTDTTYADNVVATPLVPEESFGAFRGENPNGVWTLTIANLAIGQGGSLNNWALILLTLPAEPTETTTSAASTDGPLDIDPGPPNVVTSTLTVSGAGTQLGSLKVTMNVEHTVPSDLDITLQSPAGTVVTITTDNGGSALNVFAGSTFFDKANPGGQVVYDTNDGLVTDNAYNSGTVATPLVPEEGFAAFNGEDPNGVWTLTISDDATGEGGTLNGWSLDVTTIDCSPPFPFTGNANAFKDDGSDPPKGRLDPLATSCNDGDPCTQGDSCQGGTCIGTPLTVPGEITHLRFTDKTTLMWDPASLSGAVYDGVRGLVAGLPVGPGPGETCFASGISAVMRTDGTLPSTGGALWYVVRGRNSSCPGPYGFASSGAPRVTSACP